MNTMKTYDPTVAMIEHRLKIGSLKHFIARCEARGLLKFSKQPPMTPAEMDNFLSNVRKHGRQAGAGWGAKL